jgi:2',3'-cyclic-nucleotide 2'-phosphodiesterase (5'-nucleotidase family)
MKSRRNFIQKGSFAVAALLATKPFTTLANTGKVNQANNFTSSTLHLLHSTKSDVLLRANTLKKENRALFLNPTKEKNSYGADVEMHAIENEDYKIIYKDEIRLGVITADAEGIMVAEKVNYLSAFLKNNKQCDLVVCLSNIGFKHKNALDDITLAEKSSNLDIIISGHETNFCKRPYIALNIKKEEVIINHNASNINDIGKIAIGFDKRTGKKNNVEFIRK